MVRTRKILALVVVLVIAISIVMSMTVFAESNNSILNFNQLYDYSKFSGSSLLQKIGNGQYLINTTVGGGVNWVYLNVDYNDRFSGHKLFLTVGYRHDNYPYSTIGFGNDIGSQWIYGSGIIDGTSVFKAFFRIDNGVYNNVILTPMIIDLTQMFGSGNEPTLDECYSLFPTYYNYTDSNLITIDNLDYNAGYNDGFKNGQSSNYNLVFQNSIDNITAVNAVLNSSIDSDGSIIYSSSSNFIMTSFVNFSNFVKNSRYNLTWDEITVLSPSNYSGTISFEFVQTDGGYDSYEINSNTNGSLSFFNSATGFTSFGLSFSSDVSSFKIKNLKVYLSNDVQESYNQGYNNGYSDGNRDGELNGYNKGYNVGYDKGTQFLNNEYNKGYNDGVDFASNNNFVTLFSSVIEAPVNAVLKMFDFDVLGYNMKAFLVGLFSVALTLAIIRLFL